MIGIIGILSTFVIIFGMYAMSGGKIEIILEAAPHEFPMLMGGAIGAYLVANSTVVLKATMREIMKTFKGPQWKKQDYRDLLCLLFTLCKLMKSKGMISVEQHIENPHESTILSQYPHIIHDHFATDLICDTLRTLTMGMENPMQIEEIIDKQLEKHHHESTGVGHGLQSMSDGLPAIGIVVAVLGVVKTMASINEPPAVLGARGNVPRGIHVLLRCGAYCLAKPCYPCRRTAILLHHPRYPRRAPEGHGSAGVY